MSVVKVLELIAKSDKSWEDAAQHGVEEAAKSVKNISHVYVKDFQCNVEDGKITEYKLNMKVSFLVES
jgi:hypothetical protein